MLCSAHTLLEALSGTDSACCTTSTGWCVSRPTTTTWLWWTSGTKYPGRLVRLCICYSGKTNIMFTSIQLFYDALAMGLPSGHHLFTGSGLMVMCGRACCVGWLGDKIISKWHICITLPVLAVLVRVGVCIHFVYKWWSEWTDSCHSPVFTRHKQLYVSVIGSWYYGPWPIFLLGREYQNIIINGDNIDKNHWLLLYTGTINRQ